MTTPVFGDIVRTVEWLLLPAATFFGMLGIQYVKGARYTPFEFVVGIAGGLTLFLVAIGAFVLASTAFGEMQALWLALLVAAAVAAGAIAISTSKWLRRRANTPKRSPFDFGA